MPLLYVDADQKLPTVNSSAVAARRSRRLPVDAYARHDLVDHREHQVITRKLEPTSMTLTATAQSPNAVPTLPQGSQRGARHQRHHQRNPTPRIIRRRATAPYSPRFRNARPGRRTPDAIERVLQLAEDGGRAISSRTTPKAVAATLSLGLRTLSSRPCTASARARPAGPRAD